MGIPTTGTVPVGARGKLWVSATLPFNATTALCLEFTGEGLQARASNYYNDGIRGTRSRARERRRRDGVTVSGSITLTPTKTELRTLLPLILGAAESGSGTAGDPYVYAQAETLPTFYVLVQRVPTDAGSHTKAVSLYEGCVVSRASFSASQRGPLTLTLEVEACTFKHYTHGSVSTAFDGSTAVISSGTAVPSSVPDTNTCWMFSDTQGANGNMQIAAADREAFEWSLSIDNVLDTSRFMNSVYRRTIPATDRDVRQSATVPFTTAEDELLHVDINSASPDVNDNLVKFYAELGTNDDVLQFTIGTWNIEPVDPTIGGKGELVLALSGSVDRKNSSTAKDEVSVRIWTT